MSPENSLAVHLQNKAISLTYAALRKWACKLQKFLLSIVVWLWTSFVVNCKPIFPNILGQGSSVSVSIYQLLSRVLDIDFCISFEISTVRSTAEMKYNPFDHREINPPTAEINLTDLMNAVPTSLEDHFTTSTRKTSLSYTLTSGSSTSSSNSADELADHGNLFFKKPTTNSETVNGSRRNTYTVVESSFDEDTDFVIAILTIIFIVVALFGNSLAFVYFSKNRKLTVPCFLYKIISMLEICMAFHVLPLVFPLLQSRSPILFANEIFCAMWAIMFYLFKRIEIFLVMILSLTRAIFMAFPFILIRMNDVVIPSVMFGLFILIVDIVYLSINGQLKTQYWKKSASCESYFNVAHDENAKFAAKFYSILLQMEIILPCFIVFGSFILTLIALMRQKGDMGGQKREERKKFRKVSITVSIFAGVFLLCNIPTFLLQMKYFWLYVQQSKQNGNGSFMKWYGHLLSHFTLTIFNAALNPCLYVLRMPYFRQWLKLVANDPKLICTTLSVKMRQRSILSSMKTKTSTISLRSPLTVRASSRMLIVKSPTLTKIKSPTLSRSPCGGMNNNLQLQVIGEYKGAGKDNDA